MSIYHIAHKKPFSTHFPNSRLFALRDVQISEGLAGAYAIGSIREDLYDPFPAYYEAEERRDGQLPPHLEFANLSGDEADAKRFLETFGPLTSEGPILQHDGANERLDLTWRESARDTKERLKSPSEYYKRRVLLKPLTISPKSTKGSDLVTVNLTEFWAEQEEFQFLTLLIIAIRSQRPAKEAKSLLIRYVRKPPDEKIGAFILTPEIYADFQIVLGLKTPSHTEHLQKKLLAEIEKRDTQEIEAAAAMFVEHRINSKLSTVCPFLVSGQDTLRPKRFGVENSWLCRDLIGSLYLMLFLDIEHHRRVVRCQGCGAIFQDIKENVLYCARRCENRKRSRDWWKKNGKKYRTKQREKSRTIRNFRSALKDPERHSDKSLSKGKKH
jgi:hypothetical protein